MQDLREVWTDIRSYYTHINIWCVWYYLYIKAICTGNKFTVGGECPAAILIYITYRRKI